MMNGTYDVQVSASLSPEIQMNRFNIRDDAERISFNSNKCINAFSHTYTKNMYVPVK